MKNVTTLAVCTLVLGVTAAAKPPPGPEVVTWAKLPPDSFLCTRFGPDWWRSKGRHPAVIKGRGYSEPFHLVVPRGHALRFPLKAASSIKKTVVRYETRGWPDGAALDAATGAFTWTVAGEAGTQNKVVFEAVSESGVRAAPWTMTVEVAGPALELVWSAGVGGKTWPDCTARPETQKVVEADLDGDGAKDVVLSSTWTESGDEHQHHFARHDVVLRRPRPGKADAVHRVEWEAGSDDGAFIGDVTVDRIADGPTLLRVEQHACDGRNSVEFFKIVKGQAVSVGEFEPDDRRDASSVTELDELFAVVVERTGDVVVAVVVSSWGKSKRYAWKRGAFR